MPELPEVEVVKKSLQKYILNLTIENIEIRNKFLRYNINYKIFKKMIKSKILSINRRSKYLLINLDNDYTILIHLGMTGKIIIISSQNTKNKSSFYYDLKDFNHDHDHLIIKFNKNIKIIYNDIRKFGFIKIIKTPKILLSPHLKNLGPEPFSKEFNLDYFKSKIKKRKIILKDLLMNQKFLSGLGNIYVNEAVFMSKLNPRIKVKKLLNKNILSLIKNIRKVLRKAIKQGGSSVKNFNNTKGQKGKFQEFLCVYGREGKFCIRSKCPGKIKVIRISNMSTFYCNICQK